VILKHFADSLIAVEDFPEGARIIDVGCGGGFPTFPLAIARPDLNITALDSTEKKINFVKATARELGLSNITAISDRAEALGRGEMRESFDHATARAVAALPVLSELCLPFVKVGGSFVAMKSVRIDEELAAAKKKNIFSLLGGEKEPRVDVLKLTDGGEELFRSIAVTKKLTPTPAKYPRPYAQIVKSNR
jgi:16S rRNA (guanine527-N7)-methyltransferase